MRNHYKVLASLVLILMALIATVLSAQAQGIPKPWVDGLSGAALASPPIAMPTPEKCAKMEASDAALWFNTDDEGNVLTEEPVTEYPSEVTTLAAGFEYNCIPSNSNFVIIWYKGGFDTEPWYVDKRAQKPTTTTGIYYNSIYFEDGSPIPDGDFQVEFYNNKTLLTSGEISVGGEGPDKLNNDKNKNKKRTDQNLVDVQGVILDKRSQWPIFGAVFIVLNPGITSAQWAAYAYAPSDVMQTAKANRDGEFMLGAKLERNVFYSVVAWALGYQMVRDDNFFINDDEPSPVKITIELVR